MQHDKMKMCLVAVYMISVSVLQLCLPSIETQIWCHDWKNGPHFFSFLEINGLPLHSSSSSDSWLFLSQFYYLYTAYFFTSQSPYTVLSLMLVSLFCARSLGLSVDQIETLWRLLQKHIYFMASCSKPNGSTCSSLLQR